jgi:hypothetical protein
VLYSLLDLENDDLLCYMWILSAELLLNAGPERLLDGSAVGTFSGLVAGAHNLRWMTVCIQLEHFLSHDAV